MSGVKSGNEFRDGDPRGERLARFQSVLRRFKREGSTLLVVGDAPREVFTRASASMLGDPDARRWRVVVSTDATPESVSDRLSAASAGSRPPAETTAVLDYAPSAVRSSVTETAVRSEATETAVRSSATDPSEATVASETDATVADADLDGLRSALVAAVREFRDRSFRPAEVRVAVDSLAPLLDDHGVAAVRRFLRTVRECVYDCDAMAHYVLPEPYDGDRCQRLAGEFDAVVELRAPAGTDGSASDAAAGSRPAEERWHLPASGVTMPWVPV